MTGRRATGRRLAAGTVALLLTLGPVSLGVGAAQAQSSSTSSSADKITLHVGVPSDMVAPNPFKACCSYEYEMMFNAFDMLFNFSKEDLTPVPGLAESCEPDADNLVWTCKIRSGVLWSDGQPLTSADIAFTYRFILDNGLASFSDYLPFNPTFETPDATTLIWKSEKPTFAPTVPPWIPIIPEHIWSKYDGQGAKAIKSVDVLADGPMVGSGPFVLTEWQEGQFWKMTANKGYWGGSPTIDEIVYQVFDNREAMVQALKSGEIDFADDLNPTLFNALKGEANIVTNAAAPSYFTNLAWNFGSPDMPNDTHNPALEDLVVRQAVAYGTDKQAIVDSVWQGAAQPGSTITVPSSPWHYEPPADQVYNYDPAKANQILDDAGYVDTNNDGVREAPNGGPPLEFNILTLSTSAGSNDSGKLLQGWMKDIGIKFDLQPVSESKAYALWADGDFDAYIWSWGGDPDPDFILSIFTTNQCLSWSDGCYSDSKYDQMYLDQKSIFNRDDRKTFIDTMQAYVYEQIPEMVLVYPDYLQAYRTDAFTGYVPVPADGGALLFGWGPYSYINMKPVSAAAGGIGGGGGGGTNALVYVGIGAVLLIGIVLLMSRRRRADEDRV
jgi:peptide/nickel transport system substrate-binding protein